LGFALAMKESIVAVDIAFMEHIRLCYT
jgi:hypothetical protein